MTDDERVDIERWRGRIETKLDALIEHVSKLPCGSHAADLSRQASEVAVLKSQATRIASMWATVWATIVGVGVGWLRSKQ